MNSAGCRVDRFVVISRDLFRYLIRLHQNFVNARNPSPPKGRERLLENLVGHVCAGSLQHTAGFASS